MHNKGTDYAPHPCPYLVISLKPPHQYFRSTNSYRTAHTVPYQMDWLTKEQHWNNKPPTIIPNVSNNPPLYHTQHPNLSLNLEFLNLKPLTLRHCTPHHNSIPHPNPNLEILVPKSYKSSVKLTHTVNPKALPLIQKP